MGYCPVAAALAFLNRPTGVQTGGHLRQERWARIEKRERLTP